MGTTNTGKKLPKGISQRSDGRFCGRFYKDGKSYAVYSFDLSEAIQKLADLRYEVSHGTFQAKCNPDNVLFKGIAEQWLADKASDDVKAGTIRTYRSVLDSDILPTFGKMRLKDVKRDDIRLFLIDNAKRRSDATMNVIGAVLKGVFGYAADMEIIDRNPTRFLKLPKGKEGKEAFAFTDRQLDTVLRNSASVDIGNMVRLANLTGLRRGELQALKWSDIDFKNGVIRVQHTMLQDGTLDTPKTKNSLRSVPLSDDAVSLLRSIKVFNIAGFVFSFSAYQMQKDIEKLNELCKMEDGSFPDFTLHTFRHTFATRCANKGMIPKVLMSIMGHSNINMTMNYYAHADEQSSVKEFQRVSNL